MKGALCGDTADCGTCKNECQIRDAFGDLMVANHILKDKLVSAGKHIGDMAKTVADNNKELELLRRKFIAAHDEELKAKQV
jgi:hypothetical protein